MSVNRKVKDIAEYLKEISEINAKWSNSTLVFRGQEDEEWLLESSAERRLKASLPSQGGVTDPFLEYLEYNESLVKKCRLKNYDKREQKQLDDLELLADLQHHGAATCLIDFTRNALIALWFACKKLDANGKVFVVNTADEKTFLEIAHTDIKDQAIRNILCFETRKIDKDQNDKSPIPETSAILSDKPSFWYWKPAHLNERITAQHSLFLFGLSSSDKMTPKEIIIESASKEQIQKELEELHDICEESLFPDFVGFAYIQRFDAPYLIPAEKYYRSGVKARQRGQYLEAIEDFNKAINLKPDYADAYYDRGYTYHRKDEYKQAIEDFNKVINLKPDYADAYFFRSHAYITQGRHDEAIQDLDKVIELSPNDVNAYFLRGHDYILQGKYNEAIQDFNKAFGLDPTDPRACYARGLAWLALEKWQNARSSLTAAEHMGFDLGGTLRVYAPSVADFEQKFGITLPEDIAAMLTESEN